jgi:hypothetical protein
MAAFEHLLKSCDIHDLLDEIASAEPPAYLRRCFAEGVSATSLSFARVQQLAVCAMVLDAIVNDRDYAGVGLEPELIADWRAHHATACARLQAPAAAALRHARGGLAAEDAAAAAELGELEQRLAPA